MGQKSLAGGVIPVKGAVTEENIAACGKRVHTALGRFLRGGTVGVQSDPGEVGPIGAAHITHDVTAVHKFFADIVGLTFRRWIEIHFTHPKAPFSLDDVPLFSLFLLYHINISISTFYVMHPFSLTRQSKKRTKKRADQRKIPAKNSETQIDSRRPV